SCAGKRAKDMLDSKKNSGGKLDNWMGWVPSSETRVSRERPGERPGGGQRAAEVVGAGRQPDRAQSGLNDTQPVAHRVPVQMDVHLVDFVVVRQDVAAGRRPSSGQVAAGKKRTAQPPDGVSWDSGDAITENGVAPVPGWTACPAVRPPDLDILSGAGTGAGH